MYVESISNHYNLDYRINWQNVKVSNDLLHQFQFIMILRTFLRPYQCENMIYIIDKMSGFLLKGFNLS